MVRALGYSYIYEVDKLPDTMFFAQPLNKEQQTDLSNTQHHSLNMLEQSLTILFLYKKFNVADTLSKYIN